jgi:polyhydroxybutyrate depolymerase
MQTAVVLAFHGAFGTPEVFAQRTGLNEVGGRASFVVAYPEGFGRSWNAGDCCGPAQELHIDDVAFVKASLDDLASVVNVDTRRVFATGFSNGGRFVYRLACELSNQIAAIAVVSSSMSPSSVKPTRPVPVLHIHGRADRFAPFEGGYSDYEPLGRQTSIREIIARWSRWNGCTDPRVTYERGAVTYTAHSNCRGSGDVTLCAIEEMGHQWPGGKAVLPRLFGPGSKGISASEKIIQFFLGHPMPQARSCPPAKWV